MRFLASVVLPDSVASFNFRMNDSTFSASDNFAALKRQETDVRGKCGRFRFGEYFWRIYWVFPLGQGRETENLFWCSFLLFNVNKCFFGTDLIVLFSESFVVASAKNARLQCVHPYRLVSLRAVESHPDFAQNQVGFSSPVCPLIYPEDPCFWNCTELEKP